MAKIWIEAYGCSASFADSEMISGLAVNGGHTLTNNSSEADLCVVVTCSVKDATANKMIHRIKTLKSKPLVVAGCLPKAEPTTVAKVSNNASMMGPHSIGKTLQVINSTLRGTRSVMLQDTDITKVGLPKVRLNSAVGIIEIASGCMSECTFCQTKLAKGDLQSYRLGDIVRQVKQDVEDGCKEIWLTSTDNGCYGFDIGTTLPELINTVAQIPKDFRIRVGMMNPMYMSRIKNTIVDAYANNPKVYRFIHIPVQSGSDQVLHQMKRGHTSQTFKEIASKIRNKFKRFTISTDVIVGFPTETPQDFEDTLQLLQSTKPDIVNLSRYSQRPGTEAATWKQLDDQEIKRRSKIATDVITKISHQNNQGWIGWSGPVLFNEKIQQQQQQNQQQQESKEHVIRGRNFAYKPIFIDDKSNEYSATDAATTANTTIPAIEIGQIHNVEIIDATPHSLVGRIIE